MDINRNNYEVYFLDFVEGRLSAEEEEVLHRFLRFNPDLAGELEAFSIHTVKPESISYPVKEELKIRFPGDEEISDEHFDRFCVAFLEGDLTEDQRRRFEIFLTENPQFEKDFTAFKASFLKMEHVSYPRKEALYRKTSLRINWSVFVPVAAAASLALLLFLGPRNEIPQLEVAGITEPERIQTTPEQEPVAEEKKVENSGTASMQVVKRSQRTVPVSTLKKEEERAVEKDQEATEQPVRMAGITLDRTKVKEVPIRYDRIKMEAIEPPSVRLSSLSVRELAEYQIQRATQLAENDEEFIISLASAGLKELSKLTGNEAKLLASRDEEGDISGIHFRSRFLNVSTPISSEETK